MDSRPHDVPAVPKPRILVIGVGGAGCNAVDNMVRSGLEGVEFIAANTDAQSLSRSLAGNRIVLGQKSTRGLGSGSRVEIGRAAAEEAIETIRELLSGCDMVFVAAGMGGGTGTGGAPVIAQAAREIGALTVGVVTMPFGFEGAQRMRVAEAGVKEMAKVVDTLIVIPNQNLFQIAKKDTSFVDAFILADDVLYSAVRGVTDLVTLPGLINLDFSDIRTVMLGAGKAMMGTGEVEGPDRATLAARKAIANPLLDSPSIRGATKLLINVTGGRDMTLSELDQVASLIRAEAGDDCFTIFGSVLDEELEGRLRVSVVATGINRAVPFVMTAMAREAPSEAAPEADVPAPENAPSPETDVAKVSSPSPLAVGAARPTHAAQASLFPEIAAPLDSSRPAVVAPQALSVPAPPEKRPPAVFAPPSDSHDEKGGGVGARKARPGGAPARAHPGDGDPFLAAVMAGCGRGAVPGRESGGDAPLFDRLIKLVRISHLFTRG
ncbi:MAG: cell division protein FtsZ [Magnetospirillum sp. WYHS-4]